MWRFGRQKEAPNTEVSEPVHDHLRYGGTCPRCFDLAFHAQNRTSEITQLHIVEGVQVGCGLCHFFHVHILNRLAYGESFILRPLYGQLPGSEVQTDKSYNLGWTSKFGDFVFNFGPDHPLASVIGTRPSLQSFDSERVYSFISDRMTECEKHEACSASLTQVLPTRLIDVGDLGQEPFLFCPPPGTTGTYVTLSYCWGTQQSVTLKSSMLEQSDCPLFPMTTLPPTLRDAISICRRLAFQYIWIDALCIIQDSPGGQDWISESGSMDKIYGRAALTIAASSSRNTSEGIFKTPEKPFQSPSIIRYNWQGNSGNNDAFIQYYPRDIDKHQPLNSRAWALQEYFMSTRVLSYQSQQLAWECNSQKVYMYGPLNVAKQHKMQKHWEDIVTQYTSCDLTFEDDRLIALSGFARFAANSAQVQGISPGDTYLAGLWKSHLIPHLLWYSKEKPPRPRPPVYRAPTWSWASINGLVEFVAVELQGHHTYPTDLLLKEASVAASEINPFGTIMLFPISYLKLAGYLKVVPGMRAPKNGEMPDQSAFRKGVGKSWWIYFDVLDMGEQAQRPNVYGIAAWEGQDMVLLRVTEFTALILIPVFKEGMADASVPVFQRVGLVRHWEKEEWRWFDEVRDKTDIYLV